MAGRAACNGSLELGRINISNRGSVKTIASEKALSSLSSSILMQLFPFTLVFRPNLEIISAGRQLKNMFPGDMLIGQPLPDVARIRRPKLLFTWDNVIKSCYHFRFARDLIAKIRLSSFCLVVQPSKSSLRNGDIACKSNRKEKHAPLGSRKSGRSGQ